MKSMKTESNQTKKCRSHIEIETTGKHKRPKINSRSKTKHGKSPTEIFGTDGPTEKTT